MAKKPVKRSDITNEPMPDKTQIVRLVYHCEGDRHEVECLQNEIEWIHEETLPNIAVIEIHERDATYYLPLAALTFWNFMSMWEEVRTAPPDNKSS